MKAEKRAGGKQIHFVLCRWISPENPASGPITDGSNKDFYI
jgi:hypothetical protein